MKPMTTGLVSFATAITCIAASALGAEQRGEIVIVGQGQASHAPEYANITMTVTSICYDTARGAKEANAILANQILNILLRYGAQDQVTATGGYNYRRTIYVGEGDDRRVLCEQKWAATNTLTLKTTDLQTLPDIQDTVLVSIDANAVDPNLAAQTYAELEQPTFHVETETYRNLQQEALAQTYQNARFQLQAFSAQCNFVDLRLTKITPPEYDMSAQFMTAYRDTATPIIPDEITVSASRRFTWTFEPTVGCPLPG